MRRWRKRLIRLVLLFVVVWHLFPFPTRMLSDFNASATILDRHGRELRSTLGSTDQRCYPITVGEAGAWIIPAFIAVEDKRFLEHHGIDPLAIARAMRQNLTHMRVISGASTISTQVIRLAEPRRRTLSTKAIEAFRAMQMERLHDKQAILEQYLNRTPFGGNLVGVRAASLRYFSKEPIDLNLPEAALLAGIPQSPERHRPDRHPASALKRRHAVLERMLATEWITAKQYDEAVAAPIELHPRLNRFEAPHFCDMLLQNQPAEGQIHSSLDLEIQQLAEQVFAARFPALRERGVHGGAAVILDVQTSEIRALIGSPDYQNLKHAGQFNSALAFRSPGSTLKTFAALEAIEEGRLIPARAVFDVPMNFVGYTPENYTASYQGVVTLRQAMVDSLNLPALALMQELGLNRMLDRFRRLGLNSIEGNAEELGMNVILGGCDVRLIDLANAYACIARGGTWIDWTARLRPDSCHLPTDVFSRSLLSRIRYAEWRGAVVDSECSAHGLENRNIRPAPRCLDDRLDTAIYCWCLAG